MQVFTGHSSSGDGARRPPINSQQLVGGQHRLPAPSLRGRTGPAAHT